MDENWNQILTQNVVDSTETANCTGKKIKLDFIDYCEEPQAFLYQDHFVTDCFMTSWQFMLVNGSNICASCFSGLNYSTMSQDNQTACILTCPAGMSRHPKNNYLCVDTSQTTDCNITYVKDNVLTCTAACPQVLALQNFSTIVYQLCLSSCNISLQSDSKTCDSTSQPLERFVQFYSPLIYLQTQPCKFYELRYLSTEDLFEKVCTPACPYQTTGLCHAPLKAKKRYFPYLNFSTAWVPPTYFVTFENVTLGSYACPSGFQHTQLQMFQPTCFNASCDFVHLNHTMQCNKTECTRIMDEFVYMNPASGKVTHFCTDCDYFYVDAARTCSPPCTPFVKYFSVNTCALNCTFNSVNISDAPNCTDCLVTKIISFVRVCTTNCSQVPVRGLCYHPDCVLAPLDSETCVTGCTLVQTFLGLQFCMDQCHAFWLVQVNQTLCHTFFGDYYNSLTPVLQANCIYYYIQNATLCKADCKIIKDQQCFDDCDALLGLKFIICMRVSYFDYVFHAGQVAKLEKQFQLCGIGQQFVGGKCVASVGNYEFNEVFEQVGQANCTRINELCIEMDCLNDGNSCEKQCTGTIDLKNNNCVHIILEPDYAKFE